MTRMHRSQEDSSGGGDQTRSVPVRQIYAGNFLMNGLRMHTVATCEAALWHKFDMHVSYASIFPGS